MPPKSPKVSPGNTRAGPMPAGRRRNLLIIGFAVASVVTAGVVVGALFGAGVIGGDSAAANVTGIAAGADDTGTGTGTVTVAVPPQLPYVPGNVVPEVAAEAAVVNAAAPSAPATIPADAPSAPTVTAATAYPPAGPTPAPHTYQYQIQGTVAGSARRRLAVTQAYLDGVRDKFLASLPAGDCAIAAADATVTATVTATSANTAEPNEQVRGLT